MSWKRRVPTTVAAGLMLGAVLAGTPAQAAPASHARAATSYNTNGCTITFQDGLAVQVTYWWTAQSGYAQTYREIKRVAGSGAQVWADRFGDERGPGGDPGTITWQSGWEPDTVSARVTIYDIAGAMGHCNRHLND